MENSSRAIIAIIDETIKKFPWENKGSITDAFVVVSNYSLSTVNHSNVRKKEKEQKLKQKILTQSLLMTYLHMYQKGYLCVPLP